MRYRSDGDAIPFRRRCDTVPTAMRYRSDGDAIPFRWRCCASHKQGKKPSNGADLTQCSKNALIFSNPFLIKKCALRAGVRVADAVLFLSLLTTRRPRACAALRRCPTQPLRRRTSVHAPAAQPPRRPGTSFHGRAELRVKRITVPTIDVARCPSSRAVGHGLRGHGFRTGHSMNRLPSFSEPPLPPPQTLPKRAAARRQGQAAARSG